MRVLFLTTNYPRPDSPIDGIFVREHARAAAEVADVRVLHLERAVGPGVARLEPIADEDPPAWRLRYRRLGTPLSPLAFMLGPVLGARRFRLQGWRPDVLHAHSFLSALPAVTLGGPLAYTEHWSIFLPESPNELSRPMRLAARLALRRADVVLPVSTAMSDELRRLAPSARLQVVPNVVDEAFRPGDPHARDGTIRLVTAGLFDNDSKGVDLLLEALTRLHPETGIRLDVVGDGSRRPEYEALSRRLGLDGTVAWHGLKSKPELAEVMRRADLFVLGSRYENNPCVLLEAMACGLPVVATRVGGVPEVVEADGGVLVEPRDPDALAAGIATAIGRLDEFDRSANADRTRARFGRAAIAAQLASVYRELSARAR